MFEESIKERIHVILKWSLLIGSFQMEPPDWLERIHVNLKWSLLIGYTELFDNLDNLQGVHQLFICLEGFSVAL